MSSLLPSLRSLLGPAANIKGMRELLADIDDNLSALEKVWIGIAGPDGASLDRLHQALATREGRGLAVTAFQPYRSVVDWEQDIEASMRRCTALIAVASARQFMPQTLVQFIDAGINAELPLLVLVEGLGRVRDPVALKEALALEASQRFAPSALSLSFLADREYQGETLDEAVESFISRVQADGGLIEEARANRLDTHNRVAALSLLRAEKEKLQTIQNTMRVEQLKASNIEAVLMMSLDAIPAFWSNELYSLAEELHDMKEKVLNEGTSRGDQELGTGFVMWCDRTKSRFHQKVMDYSQQSLRLLRLPPTSPYAYTLAHALEEIRQEVSDGLAIACDECITAMLTGRDSTGKISDRITDLRRLVRMAIDDRPPWHRPDLGETTSGNQIARAAEEDRLEGEVFRDSVESMVALSVDRLLSGRERSRLAAEFDRLSTRVHVVREESTTALLERSRTWAKELAESVHGSTFEAERIEQQLSAVQCVLEKLQ